MKILYEILLVVRACLTHVLMFFFHSIEVSMHGISFYIMHTYFFAF